MNKSSCNDPVMLNQWHPIADIGSTTTDAVFETTLLGTKLAYCLPENGTPAVWDTDPSGRHYLAKTAYGYVWACLGDEPVDLFSFPEFAEADRRYVTTGVIGVAVAAGRAIENFLDMGHFPYVHTGILGEEPHTEVKGYNVEVDDVRDEIVATQCWFYQPKAALASDDGADVEYTYRVPHTNCALLYKSSPLDETRRDVIFAFIQPVSEDSILAHTGMCIIDDENTDAAIRAFQLMIFGQDKPILENQYPKELPLDPRAETPIRADKTAIAYRRWLSRKGLTYGVIPAAQVA